MALEGGGGGGIFSFFTDAISPDYMRIGLEGLGTLSGSLTGLAEGMAKMANMEFVEQEVVNRGTPDAKIVPGKVMKVTPAMMTQAAQSMGALLAGMTSPLTDFGIALEGGTGGGGGLLDFFSDMVSKDYMRIGLEGLGTLSSSLTGLAEGMAKMANMEFVEQEVVNKGTPDAKVVPGKVSKVTPEMMTSAGKNVGALIASMIEPLTNFGKQLEGGTGGTGSWWDFWSDWVSPDYMRIGLESLGTLSESLGGLGEGIIKMASMSVVIQEIQEDPKTKQRKVVPGRVITLDQSHFELAAKGVGAILTGLTKPLTDFGKAMEEGSGWFSGGYIEKGLEGLGLLSESLGGLAEGVIKIGQMQVVTQKVINPGTAKAKVVPDQVITLNETHFELAASGIGKILNGLAGPLGDFGKAYAGDGEFFGIVFSDVKSGIEGMAAVAEPIGDMADAIIKMGSGQVIKQTVVKDGKGKPKLVPGEVLDMKGITESAKVALTDILTFFPAAFATSGRYMRENQFEIESVILFMEQDIIPSMELILEAAELYGEIQETMSKAVASSPAVDMAILSLDISMSTLGRTLRKDMDFVAVTKLGMFATQMERLAEISTPFEKFTKAFTQFAKDMGTFGKNFSVMTPQGIDAYKTWTDAVVTVAKTDFSAIESKLTAMRDIAASIYKGGDPAIPDTDNSQTVGDKNKAIANKDKNVVTSPGTDKGGGGGKSGGGKTDTAAIAAAIKSALSNLTVQNLTVKGTFQT
jgi:hypothetical protein